MIKRLIRHTHTHTRDKCSLCNKGVKWKQVMVYMVNIYHWFIGRGEERRKGGIGKQMEVGIRKSDDGRSNASFVYRKGLL